jgi:2-keto-3-deoxy-L-rhamnonate aldolase RhmA
MAEGEPTPQGLWENPVRKTLREGKPVFGVTLTVPSVEIAAQAANMGFDFLWIEMEHSPITLETLRNMVLATRGLAAVPFARVPVNEIWTAKRVLDAGALGVVFPFTSTPELARQAAAACKYPPAGRRGSGAGLASFRWPAPEGHYDFADRNVMVITVVEEVCAVEEIDAIAATPGIDVIFIGASDLSFSMGLRGNHAHPKVEAALERIATTARKAGKFAGLPTADPVEIKRRIDQGFQFFQTATELGLLTSGARQLLGNFGRTPTPSSGKPLY